MMTPQHDNSDDDQATLMKTTVGVVGAGALGRFYGARLAQVGYDVTLLVRQEADREAIAAQGLTVRSVAGDFVVYPQVAASVQDMGQPDVVLVGLKTTDMGALDNLLPPLIGPYTVVLTLQNGLGNEEAIAACLRRASIDRAEERVLGGIAFLCTFRTGPAEVTHTAHGWIKMGALDPASHEAAERVAAMFDAAGIRCEVVESLRAARWEKLVWNIPFNGLGVAGMADTSVVLADLELRMVAQVLMEETVAAAAGDGASLSAGVVGEMLERTPAMGAYRTSMQIDYECGRPLEVEAILGEPLRRARQAGCVTPTLQSLYALVRRADLRNRGGKDAS